MEKKTSFDHRQDSIFLFILLWRLQKNRSIRARNAHSFQAS